MNEDAAAEERLASLLIARDEALAAGQDALAADAAVPPEVQPRLGRALAALQLLHEVRPRGQPVGAAAPPAGPSTGADHEAPSTGPETPAAAWPALPDHLGRFRILRELGRGGFGVVFLAHDPRLGREVALKVPRLDALLTPELRERFQQEARAAAGLDHPHIVTVHEAGEAGPVCYLASAYCPGPTLAAWLKQQVAPVPLADAAQLVATLAAAIQHAHQRGIVHRDLKPANILLQIGSDQSAIGNLQSAIPKITDFGLAKLTELAADASGPEVRTRTGAVLGTAAYMAPEQARGSKQRVGPGADIYALGVLLYELLTGRPPFRGETDVEILLQVQSEEPLPPSRLRRRLPRDLETICLKCLEKDPRKRYAAARELAEDLRSYLEKKPIKARPSRLWERGLKWAKRRPATAALLAVGLVAVVLGGGTWLRFEQQRAAQQLAAALLAQEKTGQIAVELDQVAQLRESAQAAPVWEHQRWAKALAAARRAQGLLAEFEADAGLRQRVHTLVVELEAEARDHSLVVRLEEVRLATAVLRNNESRFDYARTDRDYAAAFREYGLDIDQLSPQEVADRVGPPARVSVAAALDDWAYVRRDILRLDDRTWKPLLELARAVDPDVQRNRFRGAWEQGGGKALEEWAAAVQVASLPPSTLILLATALGRMGKVEDSVTVLRQGQRQHPGDFWIAHQLARHLTKLKQPPWDQAIRYYTAAVALRPHSPCVQLDLGFALCRGGQRDEALIACQRAIDLQPDYAAAHESLGCVLMELGRWDEALDAYRRAIQHKPDYAKAHFGLGSALQAKKQLGEALVAYQQAIRLEPDYAQAHCNLGHLLRQNGQFVESLAAYRRGHELGSKNPEWRYPSARWVQNAEQLVQLDAKLAAVLAGQTSAAGAVERIALAELCQRYKRLYAAAARFYQEAFTAQPELAKAHRYHAARAAARAGCGQGDDASLLDANERRRWRQQALEWLQAELAVKASLPKTLAQWQRDPDLTGLRDAAALDQLPEDERAACRAFWAEVARLLMQAQGQPP